MTVDELIKILKGFPGDETVQITSEIPARFPDEIDEYHSKEIYDVTNDYGQGVVDVWITQHKI